MGSLTNLILHMDYEKINLNKNDVIEFENEKQVKNLKISSFNEPYNSMFYFKCKFLYKNDNWYIAKKDKHVCIKEEVIVDINKLIKYVNVQTNRIEKIEETWK